MVSTLVPTAEYLRMSTEHQQYSIENQAAAIRRYAEFNGFEIVRTYSDPARSGVVLKRRMGLQQLLKDVISGTAPYKAILVYDVSRWGRFQDTDEAAHYEFLCKSSGIPIHYCGEIFSNDGSLPSLIMKALKRTMAGEYTRELSVKVFVGQKRLAELGFKQGGLPGYGLGRMLVSSNRNPKQKLDGKERKSITTDRVTLVPGPETEIRVVHEIYRMLITDGLSVNAIARELNQRGIQYAPNSKWDYAAVNGVLTGLKYIGCHVFGRTSSKLYTPLQRLPKSEWLVVSGAFQPIVDYPTFAQAQHILYRRSLNKSSDELLATLKALLAREGRLSISLIQNCPDAVSPATYTSRFGSLRRAYELIGYGHSQDFGPIDMRRRTQAFRVELMEEIMELFPGEFSLMRRGGRWRAQLRHRSGECIAILIVRSFLDPRWRNPRWIVRPIPAESQWITLMARLDDKNSSFLDFHLLPDMVGIKDTQYYRRDDTRLNRGTRLNHLSDLCAASNQIRPQRICCPFEAGA